MVRNKQSNLIASVKMLNIGVINKYTINYGMGGGAIQYLLITNTALKSLFISPPPIIFLYKLYTK